jgi:MFS family permease
VSPARARRRALAPLLGAEIVSTTGTAMTALALPWLVLSTTGSPSRAGLVAAAEWLPMALLGIPSGAIASRLGPLRTMMLCDAIRAPLVALVPLLYWLDALPFAALLALAFAIGACFPAHFSSQRTILPSLLGEESGVVTRGNVMLQAANRLPLMAGPALGGALIGLIGTPGVLLVDAGTYVVAVALLSLVPDRGRKVECAAGDTGLLAGVSYLGRHRLLGSLTLANAGVELAMQMVFLCLPILAYTAYDKQVGIAAGLLAAWGAGALLGMPLAVRLSDREPVALLRVAFIAQSLPIWALAFDLPVVVLGLALVVSGITNPVVNAPTMALVTLRVPEALRAKAMLGFVTVTLGAGGIGLIVAGPAAQALGARSVIACGAALATTCAVAFAVVTGRRARRRARVSML